MDFHLVLADKDIFKNPEYPIPSSYEKRKTVKAVVMHHEEKFGFVTSPIHGFILLSEGGAETEDLEAEIIRECAEELLVEVSIIGKIGTATEYRNRDAKEYETVCFATRVEKELTGDRRTEEEKKKGLRPVWQSEDHALRIFSEQREKVERGEVGFYNTAFNIIRDERFFLEYLKRRSL